MNDFAPTSPDPLRPHRWWLWSGAVFTSSQLKERDIHPLRCIDLGKSLHVPDILTCYSLMRQVGLEPSADNWTWRSQDHAAVLTHNIKASCNGGHGARWGLTEAQVKQVRAGQRLVFQDALGEFEAVCARGENS